MDRKPGKRALLQKIREDWMRRVHAKDGKAEEVIQAMRVRDQEKTPDLKSEDHA